MHLKKYILSALFLLTSTIIFSQQEVYLDEHMNEISEQAFKEKCDNIMFKCLTYSSEGFIVKKILYRYKFGEISETHFQQIKKVLIRDSNKAIPEGSTIIIKYTDNVNTLGLTPKEKLFKGSTTSNSLHRPRRVKKQIKHLEASAKKCKQQLEADYPVAFYSMYQPNPPNIEPLFNSDVWLKDSGLFKNLFFKIAQDNCALILKPDGEFMLLGSHLSDNQIDQILKQSDWSTFKNDWKNSLIHGKKALGVFKTQFTPNTLTHCF